jgi:hypothetical protein
MSRGFGECHNRTVVTPVPRSSIFKGLQVSQTRVRTYGPPRLQAAIFDDMISLHKRIRHVGTKAAAKMEIRASQSS